MIKPLLIYFKNFIKTNYYSQKRVLKYMFKNYLETLKQIFTLKFPKDL